MADKATSGLLNGLAKREYFNEPDITDEFLKEQLFPDGNLEEFEACLSKYQSLLKNMVFSDMDMKQLEAFLTSQMKKKHDFLSESEIAAVTKFWKLNKQKIHSVIIGRSVWNNQLKCLKWRIDVNYESNEANEPKVIFEMDIEKKIPVLKKEKIMFEVNTEKLDELIAEVEKIESRIETAMA